MPILHLKCNLNVMIEPIYQEESPIFEKMANIFLKKTQKIIQHFFEYRASVRKSGWYRS